MNVKHHETVVDHKLNQEPYRPIQDYQQIKLLNKNQEWYK